MSKDITVTLTPRERALINEAVDAYRRNYHFTPVEQMVIDDMLHRIPKPKPGELP